MKPLPSENEPATSGNTGKKMPEVPPTLPISPGSYSAANRKASSCPVQRVYPWLLLTSTAVAAAFCLLYITKPVITPNRALETSDFTPLAAVAPSTEALQPTLENDQPVSISPSTTKPAAGSKSGFEESNLRVQHILSAETPGGDISRIVLDVPVLYQSRNLRWTESEVASARELLTRLADYQDKTHALRAEGVALLDAWNHLVEKSIPAQDLRADSPSLPANQGEASLLPTPANLNTTESIQIRTVEP